jgi:signal transduction histidine kinase
MRRDVRRFAIDWIPAIVLGLAGLIEIRGFEGSKPLLFATAVGVTLPVGLRRERPLVGYVLLLASITAGAIAFPANESIVVLFSLVICTYAVAQREETPIAIAATAAGAAAIAFAIARDPTDDLANMVPSVLLFVVAPASAGWGLRRRNLRIELVADEARQAAEAERRRLAREMHDVVAHAVTVMVIQAQAAQRLRSTDPDEELEALIAIEQRGRHALVELRRLLAVLRTDGEVETRAPQPGISRIAALAAEMREAGLDVVLRIEGDVSAVPAVVDVSTYRIVQEALTNALRHAGGVRTDVLVRADGGAVHIEVVDEGSGVPTAAGGGFGLTGMRERVRLLGGTLSAGPCAAGGFAVNVELPL